MTSLLTAGSSAALCVSMSQAQPEAALRVEGDVAERMQAQLFRIVEMYRALAGPE